MYVKLTSGPSFAIFAQLRNPWVHRSRNKRVGLVCTQLSTLGGKQYRVSQGDLVTVEKLDGAPGDQIEINSVLMVGEGAQVTVGQPHLEQARVVGTIVRQERGPKIIIYKHKRRKGYQKKQGHRQSQTLLRVTDIVTGGCGGSAVIRCWRKCHGA